jgi:hypothetical protein
VSRSTRLAANQDAAAILTRLDPSQEIRSENHALQEKTGHTEQAAEFKAAWLTELRT